MSLSTVITLTLVFKKLARRGTLSIRPFKKTSLKKEESSDDSGTSSCSSEERVDYNDTKKHGLSQIAPDTSTTTPAQCDDDDGSGSGNGKTLSAALEPVVRDFAYLESSPLHYGLPDTPTDRKPSVVSLSSSEFTGRQARALYDFAPETEYEIGMKAGEVIWVQYRQSPGWLIADVQDETGLIPESYVEFI